MPPPVVWTIRKTNMSLTKVGKVEVYLALGRSENELCCTHSEFENVGYPRPPVPQEFQNIGPEPHTEHINLGVTNIGMSMA